jgi:8-oxo-dGTP diphosphatase
MENHHCFNCGTQMIWRHVEEREREVCLACGWIYYQHMKVAAAALIEDQDKLLLLKRAHQPWKGEWNLPAGYAEVDEAPSMAVVREAREETGLEIEPGVLAGDYFFDDDPRGNGLLLVYQCEVVGGQLQISVESDAFGFFSADQLPENICGAGHRRAVAAWKQEKDGHR